MTTNDHVQAAARHQADRIRWLLANKSGSLEFAVEMVREARSIMESIDALLAISRATPADPALDPATVEQQHKLFVEWVKSTRSFTDWSRYEDGYAKPVVDRAWRCWLASRAATIRALASGEERK